MKKRFALLFLVLMVALTATGAVLAQDAAPVALGEITQRIIDRGELVCGVNTGLAGFAAVNDAGEYEGFDVDFCRAVAAAILGDANAVSYRPLQAGERQAAIQSGEVDLMSRNTTMTVSRDTTWGATFAPVTFYDGQGLMVSTESGITQIEALDGASICVQSGTTTELNLADSFDQRGLNYTPQVFADAASTWEGYLSGRCDAFTTDKSGLLAYKSTAEDPGAHYILEVTLSKEPLAPVTPQSDAQFADIVRWVIYATIQAEEFGITSENIDEFLTSDVPEIQRLLGTNDNSAGAYFGIPNDFVVTVIRQVGNYGEIFDRHLGPDTVFNLDRGLNALWTDGGLQYAPPFR
ncbi:MAG: amino acid ABC transporter substrate-binding protein [Anaerolineae bacterium]|nr:amino acid ABC transporter substrate-binding protein [Anaerolineae bacterium]NUQ04848.1 amino acid ABC transporter substrate-binding protein [Anaerolineae bacterium]